MLSLPLRGGVQTGSGGLIIRWRIVHNLFVPAGAGAVVPPRGADWLIGQISSREERTDPFYAE